VLACKVLEVDTADQAQTITTLRDELQVSIERARDLEGDLHAAEDSINRLEADLRTKSARLDELAKTQDDSRGTVEQARRTLAERERLINRLETEAANSQALLGNIQQSMKRLDPGASGTHEVAPEGAARLFIRTGDSEVVHMLGRKTTIGRTPDNDVQIDAKFISRHHAVILAGPTHTIIEDLNSTNGVIVNGRRVLRQTLKDGDVVIIGKAPFRFAVRPMTDRR
jgi:multidrug efflux pump subunit AcrA (membrane-fusion protein)